MKSFTIAAAAVASAATAQNMLFESIFGDEASQYIQEVTDSVD